MVESCSQPKYQLKKWSGGGGPEAVALGAGAVGVGGCARLRWSAARVLSVSSALIRYVMALWAVRGRWAGGSGQLGCLCLSRLPLIAPEFLTCVAPVSCSPLIWSPGGRSPQPQALQARSDTPRETRQRSRRRWPSGLLSPLSPPAGRPRVSSDYIAVPDHRPAHVRRKTSHPRAHPPSAAGGRRSLPFAHLRWHVRQQDTSRVFPANRM